VEDSLLITTVFHRIYGKIFQTGLGIGKQKRFGTSTVTKQTTTLMISLEKPSVRNYRKVILVCSQLRYTNHSDILKLVL